MHVCVLSHVQLFAAPRTVAHQTPLSMEFSRQEYWSGLPFLLLERSKEAQAERPEASAQGWLGQGCRGQLLRR